VTDESNGLVSIVLPVHNQAAHITAIVRGYIDALSDIGRPCEFVLAVNASRDESLAVCESLSAAYPQVRVLHDSQPGWGRAVRAGLRAARGELIGYTNSARTSARELRQLLLEAIAHPGVVVKATRPVRESWQRRIGSLLYNVECRALFGFSTRDVNATPKVFSRAHSALLMLRSDDDLLDAEFLRACVREGYPVREVPIFATRRQGGSSTTNYTSAVRMYAGALRLWWTDRDR
jgi:glycosyltransferase involved in cell wall biosynthesis